MKKAGIVVMIIGAVVLMLSMIVGFVLGGIGTYRLLNEDLESARTDQTVTVSAEEPKEFLVFEPEAEKGNRECTVAGPGGSVAELDRVDTSFTVQIEDRPWEIFSRFTTDAAGEYTFECNDEVMVLPARFGQSAVGVAAGAVIGVFGTLLGGFIVVVGLILTAFGVRNENQRLRAENGRLHAATSTSGTTPPPGSAGY